jgi:hypothetical protein
MAALKWVHGLGIEINAAARAGYAVHYGGSSDSSAKAADGDAEEEQQVSVAALLADGVLACELVAAAEARAGSRIATMAVRVPVAAPGPAAAAVHPQQQQQQRQIMVLPGTVVPRGGALAPAAAAKNWDLALAVLRERPKVPARYLWAADQLRRHANLYIAYFGAELVLPCAVAWITMLRGACWKTCIRLTATLLLLLLLLLLLPPLEPVLQSAKQRYRPATEC